MVQIKWENYSDSGSESDSSRESCSRSPSPNNANQSGDHRSPSRSSSHTPASNASLSRSSSSGDEQIVGNTVDNNANSSRSNSPNLEIDGQSEKSRSRSASRHSNQSETRHSNRSSSGSQKSKSRSRSGSNDSAKSRSQSLSQKSGSRSRSGLKNSQHSRSRSYSGSRKSISRSRSGSRQSEERSRSVSRKLGSCSRSNSGSGSDIGDDKRKRQILSDSGSETEQGPKKKKSTLIDSDSEGEEAVAGEKVDAQELFGDADDISTDEDETTNKKGDVSSDDDVRRGSDREDYDRDRDGDRGRDSDSDDGRRHDSDRRSSGSDDDDDERERKKEIELEPEPLPERRIDVEIPRIVTDLGKDTHFVKLPNFLSVETRPFDKDTYEDEIDEEETLDEEGRQRIKLKVSNTIRWREYLDVCGNHIKESNARMVKWSDGSMSLHLGNEIFDVYKQPLQGDHNHLFIRQGTGLQGQAVFRTKLTFRPHSTESFTHKKMTMSLADRSQKTSGIKILTQVGDDPDANRFVNLKKEEEKLRQAMRQKTTQSKPKRNRDTAASLNATYRDDGERESEDEGTISIAAIKNTFKGRSKANALKQGAAIYSSDEDDSDFETRRNKKIDKSKVLRALAESDEDSGSGSNQDNANSANESNDDEAGETDSPD